MINFLTVTYLAATQNLGPIEGKYGPLTTVGGNPCNVGNFFGDTMSKVIGVLTAAAVLWFVLQFILGAYEWIAASGDPKSLENARTRIIHSIIGLVIAFTALIVTSFIGNLFGFDVLDIGKMINQISPAATGTNCAGVGVGTS
jgi:hypothetical protein